jgi:hypothetical protein
MTESGRLRHTYFTPEDVGISHIQRTASGRYFNIMLPKPDCSRFMGRIPREEI